MKLSFFGATREVTGSCYLLEVAGKKVLIDCGMFQGSNFNEGKNHDDFPFSPKEVDVLLVTHSHLDHVGRIPKLIKEGFAGKIFMTKATEELARLIWDDAYVIMKENNKKYGTPILFEESDITTASSFCHGLDYDEEKEVVPGVKAIWKDAGHIFGSAFINIEAEGKKVTFSGDIGNEDVPILKDTNDLGETDILICESTYGDRLHEDIDTRRSIILNLIKHSIEKKGTIMIPAFSLERTQEFLYELNILSEHENTLPKIPVFLDSPLAIRATGVYERYPEYYDKDALALHKAGDDFLNFPGLQLTLLKEDSKKINNIPGPKMVIAGAGMMNGGRIVHHAFRYLPDPNSTLIIVGYQAEGTLGRRLYEGADKVKIFGEDVEVHCQIKAIGALSAHGDQAKLIKWCGSGPTLPKKIICTHGEIHAATELSHRLRDAYKVDTVIPEFGETIEI